MDLNRNFQRLHFSNRLIFVLIVCLISTKMIFFADAQTGDIKTDVFPLQTFDSRFYTVYLNENETITINVTSALKGNFDIFIFDSRPIESYVSKEGYDPIIFDIAKNSTIEEGLHSSLQYKAEEDQIIYIQVVLISDGTDTFYLSSKLDHERIEDTDWELNLYFIPFVPGFPIEMILPICVLTAFSIIFLIVKKKKIKINFN